MCSSDRLFSSFILHPSSFVFLTSVFWLLTPAALRAATHVTGTYSLGSNPSVMATVNGTPEYGLVFVERNKLVTYNSVQYGTQVLNAYLNASGQLNDGAGNLWVDLIPDTTASPGDSYYVVTVNIQGKVHAEIWVVPDTATVDVALVRQAQPPSSAAPASFYQFLQQSGADLPQRLKLNMTGTGVTCVDNSGALSTDCTITGGGGGGSAPVASATTSGTVKTDSTAADPVVYLKSSADTLLAGKANSSHSHSEPDVTNLVADLAGKVPTSRLVSTTSPLAGGGALSGDLTLSIPAASGSQNGYLSSGDWGTFNSKENALTFSSPLSRSVNAISCPTCEVTGNKNAASGYAGLTASSKLNASQGQEVWSAADLTDYSAASGSGSTALKSTITSPSSGQCLTWSGSDWVNGACSGGSSNHNLLSATHPDTVSASPVLGDVLYSNSTPAWTKLAGNTTTTKKYLAQTGNGSVSAAPAWTQPACGDLSNAAASCSTDTTNASNISSGTLGAARLPNPSATTLGGIESFAAQSNKWINTISTSGVPGATQPGFSDLAGSIAIGQTPLTTRGDLLTANSTPALGRLGIGTNGQCLTSNGTDPVWGSCSGAGGGASTADSFVTISHDADLTGERTLAAGSAISVTDGGANGNATIAYNPLDTSVAILREEFCSGSSSSGGFGSLGWTTAVIGTSGIAFSAIATTYPNICVLRGTTSSTSGRGGTIYLTQNSTGGELGALGNTSNNWDSKFVFRTNQTATTSLYIGFNDTYTSIPPANFIGLRLDTAASSPGADSAFRFVVCKVSACTAHGTTYTADTSFHTIRLRSTASGQVALTFDANSEICFNSGGTGGCTSSANVPTASLKTSFQIVTQTGSAQTLDVDFFAFMMTGLTR